MATKIDANEASQYYQAYHTNPSQPRLKNNLGQDLKGFIISDTDYQDLKTKAGPDFAGVMAVPAHNSNGDDTIMIVGLKMVSGEYELVFPPNTTNKDFIIDFVDRGPKFPNNTNFSRLDSVDWGC